MKHDRRPGAADAARSAIEARGWSLTAATVDPVRGHTVVVAGLRLNDTQFSRVLVIAIPRECSAVRDFVHHKMENYV
jgi:hypothetical protein